jgi:RalA-binding protein 1
MDSLTGPVTNGTSLPSEPAAPPALSTLPSRTESLPPHDSSAASSSSGSTQPLQVKKPQEPSPTASQALPAVNQSPDTTVAPVVLATSLPTVVRHSSLPLPGSQSAVSPTTSLSVPTIQNRPLARESRITLPEEAQRYIANMQESPMPSPSPRQAAFTASTLNGRIAEESASIEIEDDIPQYLDESDANKGPLGPERSSQESSDQSSTQSLNVPPNDQPDMPSAFLDLNDDDDESDSAETPSNGPNMPIPPLSPMNTTFGIRPSPPATQQEFHPISADVGVISQAASPEKSFRPQPSLVTQEDPATSRDAIRSGPDIDTRSLNASTSPIAAGPSHSTPPPVTGGTSPVMIRAQAQSSATTQAQVQAQRMAYAQSHNHEYNRGQSQPQPQPQNIGPVYSNPNARARLTESDLPRCRVSVVGSNIRANERGKEVLSFVVQVTPSGSPDAADSWKVEKLYSEVLGLDARIRSRLRRSDLKKLGSLPDSKLFKDHAPAKVDQRKVSRHVARLFTDSLMAL